jgi:hypothetical protein
MGSDMSEQAESVVEAALDWVAQRTGLDREKVREVFQEVETFRRANRDRFEWVDIHYHQHKDDGLPR